MLIGFRKLWRKETLLAGLYNHALFNLIISLYIKTEFIKSIIFPLQIAVELIAMMLWTFIWIIFASWYELVYWYLKFKYGKLFVSIMDGRSSLLACTKRPIIQVAFALEANKTPNEVYKYFINQGERMKSAHPILNCTVAYELGYFIYKRTEVQIQDVIKQLEGYETPEEFNLIIDHLASKELPQNDEFLWDIFIGKTAIQWPDEQSDPQIPVVARFNHVVGDGLSILSLLTAYLNDQGIDGVKCRINMFNSAIEKAKKENNKVLTIGSAFNFLKQVNDLLKRKLTLKAFIDPDTKHILHNCETGDRKICTYGLDTNNGEYFQKVRAIKRRVPNIKFNDVIFTAVSASLSDYIKKYTPIDDETPKKIHFIVPCYISSNSFGDIIDLKTPDQPRIKLSNKFVPSYYSFPLLDNSKDSNDLENIISQLQDISNINKIMTDTIDIPFIHYIMSTISTVIPVPLVRLFNKNNNATSVLSNFPGLQGKPIIIHGCPVSETIVWTMNLKHTGLTFMISTKKNRLTVSLQQDCSFIKTREEGQSIINGIYKYIYLLDKATVKLN